MLNARILEFLANLFCFREKKNMVLDFMHVGVCVVFLCVIVEMGFHVGSFALHAGWLFLNVCCFV